MKNFINSKLSAAQAELADEYAKAQQWLFDSALPIWKRVGMDTVNGGFHEKIDQTGHAVPDIPRRTRVVARQIYSFNAAGRMGWQGDWRHVVAHGSAALFGHCIGSDGLVISTYSPVGAVVKAKFDFYDHAFALFGLAELGRLDAHPSRATKAAEHMLNAMEANFQHPVAGFAEDSVQGVPLRANPHMHMLEACLAQASLPKASPRWQTWADRIVDLAMSRFIDSDTGALREFFDYDWDPMPNDSGRLVEPGHQFEWSWLLHEWNRSNGDPAVAAAANRLSDLAEAYGVNAAGVTIDELWDDFSVRTPTARTWPQTERLKACLQQARLSETMGSRILWTNRATEALCGQAKFLKTDVSGLWTDRLSSSMQPVREPSPASTLYHIVGALENCHRYLSEG